MVANRAYKFRIYPNDEQKILFAKTFGCVRMVYNHWLDRKIRQYEENKTNVTYTICAKEMAVMKKTEEYRFLKEADSRKQGFHGSNQKSGIKTAIPRSASMGT